MTGPRIQNPWAALVGRGDGKRGAIRAVVRRLRERGLRVGGLLQIPGADGGLLLENLATGEQIDLARHEERAPDICDFAFDGGAIARGRRWVEESGADVVMLEIGKLEARREAHWPAAEDVLRATRRQLALLCVRPDVLFDVAYHLPDPVAGLELPADQGQLAAFVDDVASTTPVACPRRPSRR